MEEEIMGLLPCLNRLDLISFCLLTTKQGNNHPVLLLAHVGDQLSTFYEFSDRQPYGEEVYGNSEEDLISTVVFLGKIIM